MGGKRNDLRLEVDKLTADIRVYCAPELKELAGQAADAESLPLSEWIVRVVAHHLERPDLAKVPRKAIGRPRKEPAKAS